MRRRFKQLIVTALLATGVGVEIGVSRAGADMGHGDHTPAPTAEEMPHDGHGAEMPHSDHGHHGALEVPADQPVPTVTLAVYPDPVAGWNIEAQTENWDFAPERVNQSSITTEGHAHLYLNGEKLTRLYSEWYYQPSLPPGEHTLTVSLNANGHEALMHNGQPIKASVSLTVPQP
ncbi:MAG: hypothetical protein F6J95_004640 [Leptolyngbya sp. SIO1E4]|nr:hypothetical protein [Leptolyngbya sp. SIO1E4]